MNRLNDLDRYFSFVFRDLEAPPEIDRREFLRRVGAGLFVFITLRNPLEGQERRRRGGGQNAPTDFNAYLRIGEDGAVTCYSGKVEMGQGIITSLRQMMADELSVPFESVALVLGDTALCPFDMGTFGSMTTRFFGPSFLRAAAEARTVLLALAAERLGLPVDRLEVENGAVVVKDDRTRRLPYGELTRGRTIERVLEGDAVMKSAADYAVMGKSLARSDGLDKVTGKARYAGDFRPEGLLHARVVRPPSHASRLVSADTREAEKLPDVRVVRDGDLIAVLHPTADGAARALDLVEAEFETPPAEVDDRTIFDHILATSGRAEQADAGGDLDAGAAAAAAVIETRFETSYVSHATMEPHTALADVKDGTATIWSATQRPFAVQQAVAEELGLPQKDVRVIAPYLGGGFGGKGRNGEAVEAARLSKAAGRPVLLAWTRQEDLFYDSFMPAAVVTVRSGIDGDGRIALWDYAVHQAGSRGARQFYRIPNHRTLVHGDGWRTGGGVHPFATGAWRAPANNTNTFARESAIDMLAARAQADPLEFRLAHLDDARMKKVLLAAAERFGWRPAAGPSGRGFGIACGIDAGAYVAHMAEVDVDRKSGQVQVKRVVCAQDMGLVVNPEGATMQVEGCVTMGLGYALSEEIRFAGGRVLDRNFDTYRIPRFSQVPRIETVLVESDEPAPQGGGEPAIICMGGVLANAIFDKVGARLFRLPMTKERVLEALRPA